MAVFGTILSGESELSIFKLSPNLDSLSFNIFDVGLDNSEKVNFEIKQLKTLNHRTKVCKVYDDVYIVCVDASGMLTASCKVNQVVSAG